MLDKYIEQLDKNESPELPKALIDLYQSAKGLDNLVDKMIKGQIIKVSQLKLVLTSILSNVEEAQLKLKSLRTNADSKELVPQGINAILVRMLRSTTDYANATIYASKAERKDTAYLISEFHTTFPFDDFKKALEDHIMLVRSRRTSKKMGTDVTTDKAIKQLARSYSKYYSKLPSSTKGLPFVAFRCPITPMFKDLSAQIEPKKLEHAAFKVTLVGDGYIVLEEQTLIAFDFKKLGMDSGFKHTAEKTVIKRLTAPGRQRQQSEEVNAVLKFIEKINERSHVKYALASPKFIPNPRNANLWLAWIVTESQRKALEQRLHTIEVEWGLPFSLDEDE